MPTEIRSISQIGTTEPFELQVARGQIPGHSLLHKFGAVPAMSQNQTGTIWDINDTPYPWSSFTSAGTLSVPAVNASDNGKTLTIEGLDADYKELSETITLSSTGAVTTTNSFIRVFRAFLTTGSNVGVINIQKSSVNVARINIGKSQTLMAIYTVPADTTLYLYQGTATCQDGADATGDMFVRYFGQTSFRVGHSFEFSGDGGQYFYKFAAPLRIPAKSDIDIEATVRSNNARLTAAFDGILIKEEGPL